MITTLPSEILYCIVEYLCHRSSNVRNLLMTTKMMRHALNQVGSEIANPIIRTSPMILPEKYFVLVIKKESSFNTLITKYPNLRMCLQPDGDIKNIADFSKLYAADLYHSRNGFTLYEYPSLEIAYSDYYLLSDVRLRKNDKKMFVKLDNINDEKFINLDIRTINLKNCDNITIECDSIRVIYLTNCHNITIECNYIRNIYLDKCSNIKCTGNKIEAKECNNLNLTKCNNLDLRKCNDVSFNEIHYLDLRGGLCGKNNNITGNKVHDIDFCMHDRDCKDNTNLSIKEITGTVRNMQRLSFLNEIKGLTRWPIHYRYYFTPLGGDITFSNQHIEIFSIDFYLRRPPENRTYTFKNCPNLRECNMLTCKGVFIDNCPNLKLVKYKSSRNKISNCVEIDHVNAIGAMEVHNCKGLKRINDISDSLIISECPNIEELHFEKSDNITECEIDALPNLQRIYIKSEHNAPIEYIRTKSQCSDFAIYYDF